MNNDPEHAQNHNLITFPPTDTLLQYLISVDSTNYLKEHFYPKILQRAGKELTLENVVLMLTSAISDYTKDKPGKLKDLMYSMGPQYLEALISDQKSLAQAIEMYTQLVKL